LYRKVLEGSKVGPMWAHLSEACVGLRGSALATLGQAHKAPKAQSASPRGNPRGTFQKGGGKTCPLLFPLAAALGLGGGAKAAGLPPI
jgi:hypothetical protein